MWAHKGRSGYGDTNLDGTYEDVINGVSPNGRQYRNEITGETRNLSGHRYWDLRKQNTPEQEIPEYLHAKNEQANMAHTLANGMANLAKYADPVLTKKTSKVSIKQKILPQASRVERLTQQMQDLVAEYKAGNMSIEEYSLLLSVVSAKRLRAEQLLAKAVAVKGAFEQETPVKPAPAVTSSTPIKESICNTIKTRASQALMEAKVFWGGSALVCMGLLMLSH